MEGAAPLWVEKYSQQHKRPYWVNRDTRQSTWTDPTRNAAGPGGAGRARPAAAAAAAAGRVSSRRVATGSSAQLPRGWVEKSHNGRPYFVSSTGERSWERPSSGGAETANPLHAAAAGGAAGGGAGVHVVGGGTEASAFTCVGSVAAGEHYDAASRRWSPLAADGARGGCAAVVVGQTLFLFGGSVTDIRSYTPGVGWASAGKYRSTRLLNRLQGVQCPGAAVMDGLCYLCGGADTSGALSCVQVYIPAKQSMSHLADMRVPRAGCACVSLNNLLYIIGGRSGVCSCSSVWYSSVEVYDPVEDIWSRAPNMGVARDGLAALVVSNRIFVFGGNCKNEPLGTAECYDPVLEKWEELPDMSTRRHGVGAAALPDGKILVTGGWDGARLLSSCEALDIATNRWSAAGEMTHARMYHACVRLPG